MHSQLAISDILEHSRKNRIVVIGDSHSLAYAMGGLNCLQIYYLGSATAHNLHKIDGLSKVNGNLWSVLTLLNPVTDLLVFVLGEIDCRAHLVRIASQQRISITLAASNTISRYVKTLRAVKALGFTICVQGVHGARNICLHKEYPTVGLEKERNFCIHEFNRLLASAARAHGFCFFALTPLLVNPATLRTTNGYMNDGVHLNNMYDTSADLNFILYASLLTALRAPINIKYCEIQRRVNHFENAEIKIDPCEEIDSFPTECLPAIGREASNTCCSSLQVRLQPLEPNVIDNVIISSKLLSPCANELSIYMVVNGMNDAEFRSYAVATHHDDTHIIWDLKFKPMVGNSLIFKFPNAECLDHASLLIRGLGDYASVEIE